ncbi:hypothetical protein M8013_20675 [Enterobacteriaceae bacterium H4N4]|uniref:HEPN AbiJ-N-terminal domain-containing protein n=1 Tax=Silvania confinis TaxID=2926470 RepID=A0A9J6QP58_9ENTR|nr:hypothetical protein [Silvania confinis]
MLTDVFSYRYSKFPIWHEYSTTEQRLLNQLMGICKEALPTFSEKGGKSEAFDDCWKNVHNKVSRELGIPHLFDRYYSYTSNGFPVSGFHTWEYACERFVTAPFDGLQSVDSFLKERINVIELAMRTRYEQIIKINTSQSSMTQSLLPLTKGVTVPGSYQKGLSAFQQEIIKQYAENVSEMNERFRRAGVPLTLHNGFIQISKDEMTENNIAKPFWALLSDPQWKNVDTDMKESLDRRDSKDKDPAIFASKALESTIKIISDVKGWSKGNEKGASNYIENLNSKANGKFIEPWEAELLKGYFTNIRNQISHGPGSKPMPTMTDEQTDWAIESAMSWIKALIARL